MHTTGRHPKSCLHLISVALNLNHDCSSLAWQDVTVTTWACVFYAMALPLSYPGFPHSVLPLAGQENHSSSPLDAQGEVQPDPGLTQSKL